MLDTAFDRVPGDIGHPDTLPFDARYAVVGGASARRAVEEGARGLLEPFVAAGLRLAADGCGLITTSCGFLAVHQRALAAALPVPVVTSSLLALPALLATLAPAEKVGVRDGERDRADGRAPGGRGRGRGRSVASGVDRPGARRRISIRR